jgi:uncharacterized integral membrane protein
MGFRSQPESSNARAASITSVLQKSANETDDVKVAALQQLSPPIPPPTSSAANIVWTILVSGLVAVLVLSVLALAHVIGHGVADDKLITIFTTSLAGLLGLFVAKPS